MRDTEEILARPPDAGLQPAVALMMLGIMYHVTDSAGPRSIVTTLLDALPPGSYLALSDGTDTSPRLNEAIVRTPRTRPARTTWQPEEIAASSTA